MATTGVANPLNHYIAEVPEKIAKSLRCKALALNVLEKISWVALIAIMAVILTVSYSGMVLTGTLSLVMAGTALSTVFFAWGVSQFKIWSDRYNSQADIQEHVAKHLNDISEWNTPRIEQFFREEGLDLDRLPWEALRKVNAKEPLCALLPLIACYHSLKERADKSEANSRKHLADQCANITDPEKQRLVRLMTRQTGWTEHEHEAIPLSLDAAVMLQIIQIPTTELRVNDLGICHAKPFDERKFDQLYAPMNNDYLVFHRGLNRQPLTLAEIEQNMTPRALRQILFPFPRA